MSGELLVALALVCAVMGIIAVHELGYHRGKAEVLKRWIDWMEEHRS